MATVEQLYQELLGREADPEGLAYWQREIGGDGITAAERARFLESAQPELSTRPETTVDVNRMYQDVLGREADEEGRRYWQSYFGVQADPNEIAAFNAAAQAELAARNAGAGTGASTGSTAGAGAAAGTTAGGTPAASQYGSLEQLYLDYLNREADPEGKTYWQNYFNQQTPGQIDVNELAAFQAAAQNELGQRGGTVVDQWYQEALKRPADTAGRAYWMDQVKKVGLTQARNMFYNQAVQELLGRTAVNTGTGTNTAGTAGTAVNTPGTNVIGGALPGGSAYTPQTINVGGAGAVTSGGFAQYPYNATQAAATLGKPAYDVTSYMSQNPVQPFVATPLFGPGQVPFIPNPYVPSPYKQQIPAAGAAQPAGPFGPITGGGG